MKWPWEDIEDGFQLSLDDGVKIEAIKSRSVFCAGYEYRFAVEGWLAPSMMATRSTLDREYVRRQLLKMKERDYGGGERGWEDDNHLVEDGPALCLNHWNSSTHFFILVDPSTADLLLIMDQWGWPSHGVITIASTDTSIFELQELGLWERRRIRRAIRRFFETSTPEIEDIGERPIVSKIITMSEDVARERDMRSSKMYAEFQKRIGSF